MKIENVDNNLKLLEKSFSGLNDINQYVQTSLTPVVRWSSIKKSWLYTLLHPNVKIRKQNDLEHSFAMVMLLINLVLKLRPHNPNLDTLLLLMAPADHEFGEAELGRDVCHLVKDKRDDNYEYLAFIRRFACLGDEAMVYHRQAFLLQFAGVEAKEQAKAWEIFSEADKDILRWLWENKFLEAYIFKYAERLEYILYALEQGRIFRNYVITEEVLRHHISDMRQACDLIPGWEEKVWTPNIHNLAMEIQRELIYKLPSKMVLSRN